MTALRDAAIGLPTSLLALGALSVLATVAVLAAPQAAAQCTYPATATTPMHGTGTSLLEDPCGDWAFGGAAGSDILRMGAWEQGANLVVSFGVDVPYNQAAPPSSGQLPFDTWFRSQFGTWGAGGPASGTCYSTFIEYAGGSGLGTDNQLVSNNGCQLINNGALLPTTITGGVASFPKLSAPAGVAYCNEVDAVVPLTALGSPAAGTVFTWGYWIGGAGTGVFLFAGDTEDYGTGDIFDDTDTWSGTYTIGSSPNILQANPTLTVTPDANTNTIALGWIGNDNFAEPTFEWRIYRSTTGGPMPGTSYMSVPAGTTSFLDTNVSPGILYTYWVTAVNCRGQSLNPTPATGQIATVPVVLTPSFQADTTSFNSCVDSRVIFADLSSGPAAIAQRTWDFGDGSLPLVTSNAIVDHTFAAANTYQVRLDVLDAVGGTGYIILPVLSIGDPNCCPVLSPLQAIFANEGDVVIFRVQAIDAEGDPIAYDVEGLSAEHEMSVSTGQFRWATSPGSAGTYFLTATAADAACTSEQDFRLVVAPVYLKQPDDDQDGVGAQGDNCASVANHDQSDLDTDGVGDACDVSPCGDSPCDAGAAKARSARVAAARDQDSDGRPDAGDNCLQVANNNQADADGDGAGDPCDIDLDGDGVANGFDNCPIDANPTQADADLDGRGDRCGDGVAVAAGAQARPESPQGAIEAEPESQLTAQMPNMGVGAIAFVAVGVLALLFAMRLRK